MYGCTHVCTTHTCSTGVQLSCTQGTTDTQCAWWSTTCTIHRHVGLHAGLYCLLAKHSWRRAVIRRKRLQQTVGYETLLALQGFRAWLFEGLWVPLFVPRCVLQGCRPSLVGQAFGGVGFGITVTLETPDSVRTPLSGIAVTVPLQVRASNCGTGVRGEGSKLSFPHVSAG